MAPRYHGAPVLELADRLGLRGVGADRLAGALLGKRVLDRLALS